MLLLRWGYKTLAKAHMPLLQKHLSLKSAIGPFKKGRICTPSGSLWFHMPPSGLILNRENCVSWSLISIHFDSNSNLFLDCKPQNHKAKWFFWNSDQKLNTFLCSMLVESYPNSPLHLCFASTILYPSCPSDQGNVKKDPCQVALDIV